MNDLQNNQGMGGSKSVKVRQTDCEGSERAKNPTKSNLIAPNPTKSHHFETYFYGSRKQSSAPCLQSLPGCGSLPRLNFDVAHFRRQLYTKWPLPVSIRWKTRTSAHK
jgi:hypothetical protein